MELTSEISKWLLSISCVAVLGVLLEIILSDGSTKKYIKSIFALIMLLVILLPLPKLLNKKFDLGRLTIPNTNSQLDDNIFNQQKDAVKSSILNRLEKNGYKNCSVNIYGEQKNGALKLRSILIKLPYDYNYNGRDKTEVYESVKKTVADILTDKEVLITVYG